MTLVIPTNVFNLMNNVLVGKRFRDTNLDRTYYFKPGACSRSYLTDSIPGYDIKTNEMRVFSTKEIMGLELITEASAQSSASCIKLLSREHIEAIHEDLEHGFHPSEL